MRLTEVTQSPGQQRNDRRSAEGDAGGVCKEAEIVGVHSIKLFKGGNWPAGFKDAGQGHDDDREKHQAALEKIGAANGDITAGKGIKNDYACRDEQRLKIRQPKNCVE